MGKMKRRDQVLPMCRTDRSVHREVTEEFLKKRVGNGQYGVSIWIKFCRYFLERGFYVELYEAKETVSKYITVHGNFDITFKLRFSNHPPSRHRMVDSDVNYWFGRNPAVSHFNHLQHAIEATMQYFRVDEEYAELQKARARHREQSREVRKAAEDQSKGEIQGGAVGQMVLFPEGAPVHHRI